MDLLKVLAAILNYLTTPQEVTTFPTKFENARNAKRKMTYFFLDITIEIIKWILELIARILMKWSMRKFNNFYDWVRQSRTRLILCAPASAPVRERRFCLPHSECLRSPLLEAQS